MKPTSRSSSESSYIKPDNSDIMISEHSLPSSGYDQLPRPKPQASESKAAVRLLAYWEKNIIPKIIDFVKSTYKAWEMEFYFEQLRFPLRNGDQQKALEEALIMCEKKMPAGCVIPDESYDWSAKMPEECIVGSWFLVRLAELKPVFGVEEIVVLLKAIDLEAKIGLVEYIDVGSMRYNIWIPLKYMYDLPMPLNIPAVCSPLKQLRENYEAKLMTANAYYAKKIIINHFTKKGSIGKLLVNPSDKLTRVKDIISWIISDEYSLAPVSGIKNAYRGIQDEDGLTSLDKINEESLTKNDLTGLVQLCAKNLAIQEAKTEFMSKINERLIEQELVETIKSGNKDVIMHLYSWISEQWEQLSGSANSNSENGASKL